MKDLTPEQIEAAIILKSLWEKAQSVQPFTQTEAADQTGIPQSNLSGLLNLRNSPNGPRLGLGPVTARKLAIFLGEKLGADIKPSTIMPSLSYLDDRAIVAATMDGAPDRPFAPLLSREQAEHWIAGATPVELSRARKIPLFESWIGKRCFAVLATSHDAAANKAVATNDILVCNPTRRPDADEMGYYNIDGDWVLGTLQRHAGQWVLTFDTFKPIPLEDEDEARVSAVVAIYRVKDPTIKLTGKN